MLTTPEVMEILGHTCKQSPGQALKNGTLVALPRVYGSRTPPARFPEPLVRAVAGLQGRSGRLTTPPQLIAVYDDLYERVRMLNKIGTGEHPITMRTGFYTPAAV
jgi:hypothetical protein